jgi:hypothetical protein
MHVWQNTEHWHMRSTMFRRWNLCVVLISRFSACAGITKTAAKDFEGAQAAAACSGTPQVVGMFAKEGGEMPVNVCTPISTCMHGKCRTGIPYYNVRVIL